MNRVTKLDQKLLDEALLAVERETGLRLIYEPEVNDQVADAVVTIPLTNQKVFVEIKRWAQQANIGAIINQIKNLPGPGILAADYVNPKMAQTLRAKNVQFLDTAGNAFINQDPIYIFVTGNKRDALNPLEIQDSNRAFEPTGLKVVFAFLCNPTLANENYREIATQAGVAQGTVGWVVKGLKELGYIIDLGKRGRRLTNYKKLFERWVETYPEKLKPKLYLGEFEANDPDWWKGLELKTNQATWGGEIAAAYYTNYLKPQDATIYVWEEYKKQILMTARLKKAADKHGTKENFVKLYQPFWPTAGEQHPYTHPILTYADLVATGDARNIETARLIYDEHIVQYCQQD